MKLKYKGTELLEFKDKNMDIHTDSMWNKEEYSLLFDYDIYRIFIPGNSLLVIEATTNNSFYIDASIKNKDGQEILDDIAFQDDGGTELTLRSVVSMLKSMDIKVSNYQTEITTSLFGVSMRVVIFEPKNEELRLLIYFK